MKGLTSKEGTKVSVNYPGDSASKFIALYGFEEFFEQLPDNIQRLEFTKKGGEPFDKKIPESLGRFKDLSAIHLVGCVSELPNSICDLPKLQFLSLPDNPGLQSLPECLANLQNLTVINVKGSNPETVIGNSEAKTSNPKKVKEMPDKGVTGTEKKMKLQEGNLGHNEEWSLRPEGRFWILTYSTADGNKEKTFDSEAEARKWIKQNLDEALYQGPSVKIGTGGSLGGKRFIPRFTALSRDAVDAINAKGAKRLNWGKPHIKIVKSGDGVKLLISKLLVDTIVGSERGRSKLSLAVSKMGTGITPEEMSELSGEFKKLVKVLSASGKLSQNGDYFLLDIPTKYNEKRNQFEMPLPAAVAESEEMTEGEQKLRSLIRNIINEELNK